MKKFFTSIALVYLVSACAPVNQDNVVAASGLSSVAIGDFKVPAGKVEWKTMKVTYTSILDKKNYKWVTFDKASFKAVNGGKAINDSIKIPAGDYEFNAEYFDDKLNVIYKSCKEDAVAVKRVEGKTATIKIIVCPVNAQVAAGTTEVVDTAVVIDVVLGSEPKPAPTTTAIGDAVKGKATLTVTCSVCHRLSGPAALITLNSSVIVKLDNTQKVPLNLYHGSFKNLFEGQNRLDLEAALKVIK